MTSRLLFVILLFFFSLLRFSPLQLRTLSSCHDTLSLSAGVGEGGGGAIVLDEERREEKSLLHLFICLLSHRNICSSKPCDIIQLFINLPISLIFNHPNSTGSTSRDICSSESCHMTSQVLSLVLLSYQRSTLIICHSWWRLLTNRKLPFRSMEVLLTHLILLVISCCSSSLF